tara:strand:- start:124 stop:432 length:309 start_codon:yes stop_codon:yes gene_type:complete
MKGVIMGSMDEAIRETVREKDFKKLNMKEYASRKKQVGGNHYKNFKIQPVEFITSNNLTFLEGNVIKYTTRARYKNGIEDYEKAKHCLELLIEHIKEHGHNE